MHAKKGFTIVELVVAVTIASVVVLAFLPMITNFLSAQYAQMAYAKQVNDMHKAITILNLDLQRAMEFRRQNKNTDTAYPAPASGWHFVGSDSTARTLILGVPATTQSYQNADRKLVMVSNSHSCNDNDLKEPLIYDAVYYVQDGVLYRRSIVHKATNLSLCDGATIYQKTTNRNGAGGALQDIIVLRDVKAFEVTYHSNNKSTEADSNAYGPTSISNSERATPLPNNQATIKLTSSKLINGNTSEYSATTRGSTSWNQ